MSKAHRGRKHAWPRPSLDEIAAIYEPQHAEDPDDPDLCVRCGCAYPCPGSVVPAPVEPVSLTRGGFMLGR